MKPTKEQLKNCIKKLKEEEKEREKEYKEWRASLKPLKKKVSVFSFRLPPPNPDLMKDQKIKERYLYNLWQLEKSPNSGHLNIDIEFRGLKKNMSLLYISSIKNIMSKNILTLIPVELIIIYT